MRAVAKPAFQRLTDKIGQVQRKWLLVADIFHKIVDMAYDERIVLDGGPRRLRFAKSSTRCQAILS